MIDVKEISLEIQSTVVQQWLEQFRKDHTVDKTEDEPEYACPWIWG